MSPSPILEPVRGSLAYLEQPGLLALSGLEQLRLFVDRRLPGPPIYHLTGLVPVEVDEGTATFSMPASPWWQSSAGIFPGGAFAFAADAALGSAIYTTLPGGMALATAELSMNFLRPATPDSGEIRARGTLIQASRRQGLSEATVEDAQGRMLAHATSRCVLRQLPFSPEPPGDLPRPEPPAYPTPDPHERPPEGEVVPQSEWDETSGLDLLLGWLKGEHERPPSCQLVGGGPVEVSEGAATWAMPASQWFCSAYGTFYGGAIAMLADGVINSAVISTVPAGTSYGTLDLKVNFLRPVTPDGRDLRAAARVVHRGRTVAVSTAEIDDADGKRVAMATGSAMIFPGRPWARARPVATLDEEIGEEARR